MLEVRKLELQIIIIVAIEEDFDSDGDQNKYDNNKNGREQKTDAALGHMREWSLVKSDPGSKR